jgi:uncharacterized protein YjbI with pentapeptide repeats
MRIGIAERNKRTNCISISNFQVANFQVANFQVANFQVANFQLFYTKATSKLNFFALAKGLF